MTDLKEQLSRNIKFIKCIRLVTAVSQKILQFFHTEDI